MKKAITLALAALIATMALGLTAFAAGPTVTLESKTITSDTKEVTLILSIADAPPTSALSVDLLALPAGFTLTKIEDKVTATGFGIQTDDQPLTTVPYPMGWIHGKGSSVDINGALIALTFTIAEGTLVADTPITISIASVEGMSWINATDELEYETVNATLTVTKTQAEIDAENKAAVEEKIDELLAIEDLDEDTKKALEDLKAGLEDANSDQLADLADLFADVDADQITPEDLATLVEEAQKVLAEADPGSSDDGSSSNAGGESSTNGGGSTNTGETTMIAAAIATVAIAGAAIVALKKRK